MIKNTNNNLRNHTVPIVIRFTGEKFPTELWNNNLLKTHKKQESY